MKREAVKEKVRLNALRSYELGAIQHESQNKPKESSLADHPNLFLCTTSVSVLQTKIVIRYLNYAIHGLAK